MEKYKIQRLLGLFCFTLGLLLSLVLIAAPAWADLEASYYGFDRFFAEDLKTLHCPVLLERGETGSMWVKLSNETDREVKQIVLVRLSGPVTLFQAKQTFPLAPGETQRTAWTISADNIDLGNFVFAHVVTYPVYMTPMREKMCGVFVVDLPGLTGPQIFYGMLGLAILALGFGLWLWDTSRIPEISRLPQVRMAMRFLVLAVLAGLLASALSLWMAGVVALVVILLTMTTVLYMVTTG